MTTTLCLALVLCAAPTPDGGFAEKFKLAKLPLTLSEASIGGTPLTRGEVAEHVLAGGPKNARLVEGQLADAAAKVFAEARVSFKDFAVLVLRLERRTPDVNELTHFLLTFGPDGKLNSLEPLATSYVLERHRSRQAATLGADRSLLVKRATSDALDDVDDDLSVEVHAERRGTLDPTGAVTLGKETFTRNTGAFRDQTSKEELVLLEDSGQLRALYRKDGKAKFRQLEVSGQGTSAEVTVRFKDGKPYRLTFDAGRTSFTSTSPDGKVQKYAR